MKKENRLLSTVVRIDGALAELKLHIGKKIPSADVKREPIPVVTSKAVVISDATSVVAPVSTVQVAASVCKKIESRITKFKPLKAPFPYFGGKSRVASKVWQAFGDVKNYVEPFCGSAAVLLDRPDWHVNGKAETINDLDGLVTNAWRAIKLDPLRVAHHANWPVSECDLHARHLVLVAQQEELTSRLCASVEYCDPKLAAWWIWGMCAWIGSGFCSGKGPWQSVDGRFVAVKKSRGINRQRPHLGDLIALFHELSTRLRNVRICCGSWDRVCGSASITTRLGGHPTETGVFLDPPYGSTRITVYRVDSTTVLDDVRAWCIDRTDDPKIRIALCGYEGEHEELLTLGWREYCWKTRGGFGSQGKGTGRANSNRERIYLSPRCHDVI